MAFLVKLSGPSAQPVTVQFATKPGTAKPKSDFLARKGALAFAPGQTVLKIVVKIKGDRRKEKHEKFQVLLANAALGNFFGRHHESHLFRVPADGSEQFGNHHRRDFLGSDRLSDLAD